MPGPLELIMDSSANFLQFSHNLYNLYYYSQKLQLKFTVSYFYLLDTQIFPKLWWMSKYGNNIMDQCIIASHILVTDKQEQYFEI